MTALPRRNFLKAVGAVSAAGAAPALAAGGNIALLIDPAIAAPPIAWATEKLRSVLSQKGATLNIVTSRAQAAGALVIIVAGPQSALARDFAAPAPGWGGADSVRLVPAAGALLVSAQDVRGFVYGLLELAERVTFGGAAALHLKDHVEETSPNAVRAVARAFCSEIEDKVWYYDRDAWRAYLDLLVACRFNRFNLAFGFGYDFPKGVTGDYFHFPYPYLVTVPGHDVKITPALAPGEREKNLETLKFIAAETGARGLDFQLGIWTHAWEWTESPHSDHIISGLKDWADGAAYSRDALAMLLKECPQITGVTLRVHGESGVPEGSYPFWQTVFEAFAKAGRRIEIDMHAKGINQIMIDMAVKTGQPVKVGAKYSAEHQSLGYHQADIRELEIPTPERMETGVFAVSNGERRFTRYGYADLFQQGQKFDVLFRLWPGTQRHLLSGDPALAAALGRSAHFCGAAGLEICEPLTFKGREGSGHPGGRNAYVDPAMDNATDWCKFADSYRLWGRLLYNPDATPDAWRRTLSRKYGKQARAAETALAAASRVLPLLTTASLPSASNHSLWYEVYTNQPLVAGKEPVYRDTPKPFTFGACSPLDPQLFSTIDEHAADLLAGRASPKYSPAEVAVWLDGLAATAETALAQVTGGGGDLKRLQEDVRIQSGIARFFAAKMRAGLLFALWQQGGDDKAGAGAVTQYEKARAAWTTLAGRARTVYVTDVAYGSIPMRRGHWADRLPAIDADLAAVRAAVAKGGNGNSAAAIARVTTPAPRLAASTHHVAPTSFHPGTALSLTLSAPAHLKARLFYRHVNQGERWLSVTMTRGTGGFTAAIPGDYTRSPFGLQYYFVLEDGARASFVPAFNAALSNQPYYAVWKRGS